MPDRAARAGHVSCRRSLACSLLFFVVDQFRGLGVQRHVPPHRGRACIQCYVAALPFLKYTVAGDLFWAPCCSAARALVQLGAAAVSRRSA